MIVLRELTAASFSGFLHKMIDYKLKTINQDFQVTEVSIIPPFSDRKNSSITYLKLSKSGWTTFDAQDEIKKFFDLDYDNIRTEGLKDEDAITSQIVSIAKILHREDIKKFNLKYTGENYMELSLLGFGNHPLNPGILHGNCFKIVIRNLTKKLSENVYKYCSENQYISFINYYDSQRFGTPGSCHNTHLIGKAIIDNNWDQALEELIKSGNKEIDNKKTPIKNPKELFLSSVNPNKVKFFVKSYDSYNWNKSLSKDLYNRNHCTSYVFQHIGKLYLPHFDQFLTHNSFIVPAHVFLAEEQLVGKKEMKRRSSVTTNIICYAPEHDELYKGKHSVLLDFFLPTGSYGTMLIRQLFLKVIKESKVE